MAADELWSSSRYLAPRHVVHGDADAAGEPARGNHDDILDIACFRFDQYTRK